MSPGQKLTEADQDDIRDQAVHHAWYPGSGNPAPSDYTGGWAATFFRQRCK